jgi:caffeoyl-CoA O-methyltransferase
MKGPTGAILQPAQEEYLDRLLPPGDALLEEMEAHAARDDVPISDRQTGRLLELLAASSCAAGLMLEIGTAIGYGALRLARGAGAARVITIDSDAERLEQARGYLERGGVLDRVELVHGKAMEVIPTLSGPFDLVYVDAVKQEYRYYLDQVLPKVRVGGLLVFDNLLWSGAVARLAGDFGEEATKEEEEDERAHALRVFNPYLMIHPQLSTVLLPMGDGVGLAVKRKATILEQGGPF